MQKKTNTELFINFKLTMFLQTHIRVPNYFQIYIHIRKKHLFGRRPLRESEFFAHFHYIIAVFDRDHKRVFQYWKVSYKIYREEFSVESDKLRISDCAISLKMLAVQEWYKTYITRHLWYIIKSDTLIRVR